MKVEDMKMKKMRGVSLIGFLFTLFVIVLATILGIKLVPSYVDHYELQRSMEKVAQEAKEKALSGEQIRELLNRKLDVNNLKRAEDNQLKIEEKEGGERQLSFPYEKKIPIFGNIAVVLTFEAKAIIQ